MGDVRVEKTKERLRTALAFLLQEVPFERVSVTDLCRQSGVSRITFYAYYDDKFALADELFDEMLRCAARIFHELQDRYNPADDPRTSCRHLLDAALEMQEQYQDFLARLALESNSYLAYAYYWFVLRKAEEYSLRYVEALRPVYPARMAANLLCTGIWSFIRTGRQAGGSQEALRQQAEELLDTLLHTSIFPGTGAFQTAGGPPELSAAEESR
jgi:AcrR family transcriptional regulator